MRITDILGKHVQRAGLGEDLLEELVGVLLRHEQGERHPTGKVIGPGKTKAKDGGRDVVVVVERTPTTPRGAYPGALTWDDVGRTLYSCKAGPTWFRGVAKDLRVAAVREASKPGAAKLGPKAKRPPRGVLEHFELGGRYVVVTDQRTTDSQRAKLIADLTGAVGFWLNDANMRIPATLAQQVELIDGNHLASYLREHRLRLPAMLREPLGLRDAPGLKSWEQWGNEQVQERGIPPFVPDSAREAMATAIRAAVAEKRVIRVVGPPGVGKTRAVYEALRALANPSATVVYTSNPDDGHRAIEEGWLSETSGVVLVIDEVRSSDVMRAAPHFRANARASLLVLLGTSDADASDLRGREIDLFELDRLDEAASRMLIATVLGVAPGSLDPRLSSILQLAEGYPLFMVLLAQAFAADGDVLIDGEDETSRWEAAKRVIVGPKRDYGDDHSTWDREAQIKAKCLLVVILAGHVDLGWDDLWERFGERFRSVLDEPRDWPRVKQAEAFCVQRGILRRPDSGRHYRYVSPNNLVRIILNRFFGPPDGLGPRFVRHLPEFRERLLEVAQRVEALPALRQLARCECIELERRYTEEPLDALTSWMGGGGSLYLAARVLPEQVARSLVTVLLGWTDEQFETAKDMRSAVRHTLEHLVRRRIDAAVFAGLEAALLRSARSEFEPWGNNATAVWRSLFLPVLSQTHRPWDERLALLKARLADPRPAVRALAVGALDGAVGASESGLGRTTGDEVDGAWPMPTNDQVHAMKVEAWKLLLLMASDPAEPVATVARKTVTQNLRGAVVAGLLGGADDVSEGLVSQVSEWSRAQKTALLAEIAEIQAWHALPDQGAFLLAAVEAALVPTDFGERLSNQVGDWYPGGWTDDAIARRERDERGDFQLIDEALESPARLLGELSWLVSDEAVRRPFFMKHAGLRDRNEVFLPHLEEHALRAETAVLLVPYVVGRAEADGARLERWLEQHRDDVRFDRIVAEVLVWTDIDDRRVTRLRDVIRRTPIPAPVLMPLAFRLDRSKSSPSAVLSLIDELANAEATVDAGLPLIAHVLARHDLDPGLRERAMALAETLLHAVEVNGMRAATAEVAWEATVRALADEGRIAVAIDATMIELLRGPGSARAERVARWFLERGRAAAVWDKVSTLLGEGKGFQLQWALRRLKLTAMVDPVLILDWVGADESRARMIARVSIVDSDVLDPLIRGLLIAFGAEGLVAHDLVATALSLPRAVGSPDEFHARQRSNARRWSEDSDPNIRKWASRVVAELDRLIADEELEDEARRRYAG